MPAYATIKVFDLPHDRIGCSLVVNAGEHSSSARQSFSFTSGPSRRAVFEAQADLLGSATVELAVFELTVEGGVPKGDLGFLDGVATVEEVRLSVAQAANDSHTADLVLTVGARQTTGPEAAWCANAGDGDDIALEVDCYVIGPAHLRMDKLRVRSAAERSVDKPWLPRPWTVGGTHP